MKLHFCAAACIVLGVACGDDEMSSTGSGAGGAGANGATQSGATQSGPATASSTSTGQGAGEPDTTSSTSSSSADGGGGATSTSTGSGAGEPGDIVVGEWQDAPGACPDGTTQVDISTAEELAAASRGEDAYAGQGAGTCYFIHDGVYTSGENVLLYIHDRAASVDDPIYFIGQSRDGVVIHHRTTIENASGIVLENMTFDLAGYQHTGAFNTLSLEAGSTGIRVRNVTFTGDCATGSQGGHVETADPSVDDVVVTRSIIERYGDCDGAGEAGHLDHGVYVAAGANITLHNNVIRGNASRGIQVYTQNGDYGTVTGLAITNNLIEGNGHDVYEDGIVINGAGDGAVSDVRIAHNVIAGNFYSGIRFGTSEDYPANVTGVVIEKNTFFRNGEPSGGEGSEIADDIAGGIDALDAHLTRNIFVPATAVVDACMPGVGFDDNVVSGPPGDDSCQQDVVDLDPQLEDPSAGRYRPLNAAAEGYGAYALD